jgi:hypothetical protein
LCPSACSCSPEAAESRGQRPTRAPTRPLTRVDSRKPIRAIGSRKWPQPSANGSAHDRRARTQPARPRIPDRQLLLHQPHQSRPTTPKHQSTTRTRPQTRRIRPLARNRPHRPSTRTRTTRPRKRRRPASRSRRQVRETDPDRGSTPYVRSRHHHARQCALRARQPIVCMAATTVRRDHVGTRVRAPSILHDAPMPALESDVAVDPLLTTEEVTGEEDRA